MKRYLKNRKIKPLLFIIIALTISIIGMTFAYMSNSALFSNKFQGSAYDVAIEEEFYNDWGTKKVTFVNNDATPVVIRVNFNEKWNKKEEDVSIRLSNTYQEQDLVIKDWTDAWQNDFVKGNDGWYYYKHILNNEDRVQVLNSINKNEELLSTKPDYQQYKESDYELDFNFEATQASSEAIKELWGIETTISNNDITWKF